MADIIERARSPEFADVAEKYLLAECAVEIERLRGALSHIARYTKEEWAQKQAEFALGGDKFR